MKIENFHSDGILGAKHFSRFPILVNASKQENDRANLFSPIKRSVSMRVTITINTGQKKKLSGSNKVCEKLWEGP